MVSAVILLLCSNDFLCMISSRSILLTRGTGQSITLNLIDDAHCAENQEVYLGWHYLSVDDPPISQRVRASSNTLSSIDYTCYDGDNVDQEKAQLAGEIIGYVLYIIAVF